MAYLNNSFPEKVVLEFVVLWRMIRFFSDQTEYIEQIFHKIRENILFRTFLIRK